MTSTPFRLAASGVLRLRVPSPAHALVPVTIGGLWAAAISNVRLDDMTDLGLVSVMPASAHLLLAALAVSFCAALYARPLRPWVALVHVLVLVTMLYGVTAFLYSEPRFSTVYRHAGIIDNLLVNRATDPTIDAYFNWPGFFALGGMLTGAAGVDALALAPWASLGLNLLFMPALVAIFRWASDDPRVTWLGLWVFYSANWVGQDYLAPQAAGALLWLTILAALLTWFTPRANVPAGRSALRFVMDVANLRRMPERLRREAQARVTVDQATRRAGLVVLVVVIYAAIVSGHQLTPFPALLTVTALVLFSALETRALPILMAVILAAWLSYQTTTYLAGHFDTVTGSVGSTGQSLNRNVSERVTGSPEHAFIVQIRVWGSAAIWLLAAAGAVRRLRAGRADIALLLVEPSGSLLGFV